MRASIEPARAMRMTRRLLTLLAVLASRLRLYNYGQLMMVNKETLKSRARFLQGILGLPEVVSLVPPEMANSLRTNAEAETVIRWYAACALTAPHSAAAPTPPARCVRLPGSSMCRCSCWPCSPTSPPNSPSSTTACRRMGRSSSRFTRTTCHRSRRAMRPFWPHRQRRGRPCTTRRRRNRAESLLSYALYNPSFVLRAFVRVYESTS